MKNEAKIKKESLAPPSGVKPPKGDKKHVQANIEKKLMREEQQLAKKEREAIKNAINKEKKRKNLNGEDLAGRIFSGINATVGIPEDVQEMRSSVFNIELMIIILLIFPTKDIELDTYFNSVFAYLTPAVLLRLHITVANFTTFSDLMGGPRTPVGPPPGTNGTAHTWNYVYPLEKAKATHTGDLKTEKQTLKVQIKAAILVMYADIPDNAIILLDTTTLGITKKANRKKAVKDPAKITVLVVFGITALGGGQMRITCRTATDAKRNSKLNRYVNIEISYSLIERTGIAPATAAACTYKTVITKANYILELGEDAAGMKLVLFGRWVYTKHPTKSGSYGSSLTRGIS